jgi:hypothetical protein
MEQKGYKAVGNYRLVPTNNETIEKNISAADYIFWSSYTQFEFYGKHAKTGVKHLCAGGENSRAIKAGRN